MKRKTERPAENQILAWVISSCSKSMAMAATSSGEHGLGASNSTLQPLPSHLGAEPHWHRLPHHCPGVEPHLRLGAETPGAHAALLHRPPPSTSACIVAPRAQVAPLDTRHQRRHGHTPTPHRPPTPRPRSIASPAHAAHATVVAFANARCCPH